MAVFRFEGDVPRHLGHGNQLLERMAIEISIDHGSHEVRQHVGHLEAANGPIDNIARSKEILPIGTHPPRFLPREAYLSLPQPLLFEFPPLGHLFGHGHGPPP